MKHASRREFLQSSAVLLAAMCSGTGFTNPVSKPLLSFSTLGCPDWTFPRIVEFATAHGYSGIELRGIQRELDLLKCKEFNSAQATGDTIKLLKDNNLQLVNLGSSCNLHFAAGAERTKNLDEGKKFIDLAVQANCPYIRVFPNNIPKGQEKQATLDLIVKGLQELAAHAKGTSVTVLMETHGDLVKIADLQQVMQAAGSEHLGLIWDISNMWTVTKEPPAEAYKALKQYIRHTHIKDARLDGDKLIYALLGQGEVPIFEAIDLLVKDSYSGYFSFEWEKLWHPEIAAPELALADYPKAMAAHFAKNKS
jgi:sugar phosphate isomerase/epimerase